MNPQRLSCLFLVGIFLSMHQLAFAQLPPLQPEQDCINALPVCQDIFVQNNSYVGEGVNPNEIDAFPSCLDSGEKNDVWYIFTVQTSGILSFTITPNNLLDDYDWGVYNITQAECTDIFSNPALEVSCNWSFVTGQTGPNGQGPGGFFNPFNPTIPVQAGDVYVVNVSNFSSTNFGYTLDFSASSAQIFDNVPPELEVGAVCIGGNIPFSFSENVQCTSIQASDFTITGPGGPYTITEILANSCQNGGSFEQEFELVISPTISQGGSYDISLVDEVLDICGNVAVLSTETVEAIELSASFTFDQAAICQDSCIIFSYTGETVDPAQSFQWDFGTDAFPQSSPLPNPTCVSFNQGGIQDISLTVSFGICSLTETKSVEIYNTPIVDAGNDLFICEGSNGLTLAATVSNGTPGYSFQWSCNLSDENDCGISDPTAQNPMVSPNEAILGSLPAELTYYVQVVDGNACASIQDSVQVEVRTRPKADAGPDRTICAIGPGAFLDGGPAMDNEAPEPFTYLWSPVDGLSASTAANPFARPSETTTYTLTLTAANGCMSNPSLDTNSTAIIFVDPLPIAEAKMDTVICQGDTIQLFGSATVAGPDYTYVWTPANTGYMSDPTSNEPFISPNFTTLYFLVATSLSNGCSSLADSVRVTVSSTPTVSAGPNQSICLGESVTLQGSASGDPTATLFSYSWTPALGLSDPNITNPNAKPDTTTTYELVATSNFGCGSNASSMQLTVKPTPMANAISKDTIMCEGDQIMLLATADFTTTPMAPVTYSWSPDSSILSNANISNITVAPIVSTNYIVTASISGDCPTTDTVVVGVTSSLTAMASADEVEICSGTAVQLQASGGFGNASFQWIPSASVDDPTRANPLASPDTTTIYQVILSEGACDDTAEVAIKVNPTPTADYFSSEPNGCEGLSVNFIENTQDALAFIWDFGDGSPVSNEANPVHIYELSGSYTVTLTTIGVAGCSNSSSAMTINISEAVQAGFSANPSPGVAQYMPSATINFTDMSSNALQWVWDFGDGQGASTPSPSYTYSAAGDYQVTLTVTGENGCIDQFTLGPFLILKPQLMIPNFFSPNGDGINDAYQVRYLGGESFYMEIYDRWGRNFFEARNSADGWPGLTPSGDPAQDGVYFYLIQIGEKNYTGNLTLLR